MQELHVQPRELRELRTLAQFMHGQNIYLLDEHG